MDSGLVGGVVILNTSSPGQLEVMDSKFEGEWTVCGENVWFGEIGKFLDRLQYVRRRKGGNVDHRIWLTNASMDGLAISYYIKTDGKSEPNPRLVGPHIVLVRPMEVVELGLGAAGYCVIYGHPMHQRLSRLEDIVGNPI